MQIKALFNSLKQGSANYCLWIDFVWPAHENILIHYLDIYTLIWRFIKHCCCQAGVKHFKRNTIGCNYASRFVLFMSQCLCSLHLCLYSERMQNKVYVYFHFQVSTTHAVVVFSSVSTVKKINIMFASLVSILGALTLHVCITGVEIYLKTYPTVLTTSKYSYK